MEGLMQVTYDAAVKFMLGTLERNVMPDTVTRRLTRFLLRGRLRACYRPSADTQLSDLVRFAHSLREMPIAIQTDKANEQYELPTSFFKLVLGPHLKYSCCYFSDQKTTLDEAEKAMLELYCERSGLKDGHTVLDIGSGWGSLCLYIAKKYSGCSVTGIVNSVAQKAHIQEQCKELELNNVEIIVADISTFEMEGSFDTIFSIGMFEHMKNYRDLLKKISEWMKPDAHLFIQHFCHKAAAYHYEMTGFLGTFSLAEQCLQQTSFYTFSEEWLKRMDGNINVIKPIMEIAYGKNSAVKWTAYWRTFFIAVEEQFGYNNGQEWMVVQFLFKKK